MSADRRPVGGPSHAAFRPSRIAGRGGATSGLPPPAIVVVPISAIGAGSFSPGSASVLWGYAALTTPSPALFATSTTSTGANAASLAAPRLGLSAFGGADAPLLFPAPTLSAAGTGVVVGKATLAAPAATVDASAVATGLGSAALRFGSNLGAYNIVGYSGAVLSATIGGATVAASGTAGSTGRAALTLPLFELTAAGTVYGLSYADLIAPAPRMGAAAQAWLIAPRAVLTAIGTATVTATYEAYAINLNHKPRRGVDPVDEVTRYTNFPFDRIIRYKNSYFGVAADGLYLLEGTTDFATPTPTPVAWAFKTAITDFGSAQQKTVESMYFGGRMGAATVALHAGESAAQTYIYPTPTSSAAQNYRQVFGRGIKARYFAFSASGSGPLELDDLDFSVGKLTRRI